MFELRSPRFHAVLSAYLSILCGVVITVFSIFVGHAEISMTLYGIALMAIVDVTGSVIVLAFWQSSSIALERTTAQKKQEAHYTYIIGVMMLILGLFLIADSAKNLIEGRSPNSKNKFDNKVALSVAIFGAVSGLALALYKYFVAKELDSSVIMADSISSLCSALTDVVALIVVWKGKSIWWLDGVAGLVVAFYTLYSGSVTMTTASYQYNQFEKRLQSEEGNGFLRLMNKYKYSYQNDTGSNSNTLDDSQYPAGTKRSNRFEIASATARSKATPYNYDYESRQNSTNVMQMIINGIYNRFLSSHDVSSSSVLSTTGYDSIPNSDSEEEVTFSA